MAKNKLLADELRDYSAMFIALKDLVEDVPEEMLTKRPQPDKWSIRELVNHVVDAELNFTVRMMRIIAEKNPVLNAYDQDQWAKNLYYNERDLKESLLLFGLLHSTMNGILGRLPQSAWTRTGKHEEKGNMKLRDILKYSNDHCKHHLAQIVAAKMNLEKNS
jgi:uncharacterized damage-inducible protein DinB